LNIYNSESLFIYEEKYRVVDIGQYHQAKVKDYSEFDTTKKIFLRTETDCIVYLY